MWALAYQVVFLVKLKILQMIFLSIFLIGSLSNDLMPVNTVFFKKILSLWYAAHFAYI